MDKVAICGAFAELKPFCDSLMRKPTEEAAKKVCDRLTTLPSEILQNLLEYILLPPILHLETVTLREGLKLNLLEVIKELVNRVRIIRLEQFYKLYVTFLLQLRHDKKDAISLAAGQEELKLTVLDCIKSLFLRSSLDVIESIYSRKNAIKLSESFYLCINIAKNERYSVLRVAAIETLMILSYTHDEADASDIVLRSQVADIVMLYFPGIVRGMVDTFEKNDTQNHKVTLMAVRALARIIGLVMNDSTEDTSEISTNSSENSSDPLGINSKLDTKNGLDLHLQGTVRNRAWLTAASEKLVPSIKKLKGLTKHSHCNVRRELVTNVHLLLTECPRNMNENVAELIDILIILSEDDADDIRELARKNFHQVHQKVICSPQMKPIIEIMEDSLYNLLTQLPRLMRKSDDVGQLNYLNQLTGYLRIFGKERLPKITNSIAHLRRLLLALVYVCELDCHEISIFNENPLPLTERGLQTLKQKQWKKFKFLHDMKLYNKLETLCKLLGELGDVETLVHSLFQLMLDMPQYRKELTLLLNFISMAPNPLLKTLYPRIIESYTDFELWYLPIEIQDDIPLCKVQSNILQICLLLDGLGIIAKILRADYQAFLLKTVYIIIERAGNKNCLIASVGLDTLEALATSQGFKDLNGFITSHVDYITYHITVKLRRIERNEGVLDVIAIVMVHSTLDLIPYLKAIVEETLGKLAKTFEQHNSEILLKVLHTFVTCIRHQVANTLPETTEKSIERSENSIDEVIDWLLGYSEAKLIEKNALNEDIECDEEENHNGTMGSSCDAEENFQSDSPLDDCTENCAPEYIQLVDDIMRSTLHFVPSKKITESALAMQILYEGLKILTPWNDKLLPIIHQLWHPLVDRFKEKNLIIMKNAWQVLYITAQVSQDFVRHRTLEQVIPSIATFLEMSSEESYGKQLNGPYTFTQMFKLQRLILDEFGLIAQNLKLQERPLWQILSITACYLHDKQQPLLQESCKKLYKIISHFNSDAVWTKCHSLCSIHTSTQESTIEYKNDEDSYKKNIEEILYYVSDLRGN